MVADAIDLAGTSEVLWALAPDEVANNTGIVKRMWSAGPPWPESFIEDRKVKKGVARLTSG